MTRHRWPLAALLALSTTLWAASARADSKPDVWARAKEPSVGAQARLHREVSGWRRTASATRSFGEVVLLRVREALERADVEHTGDARLRFDLGIVYEELGLYNDAVRVLEAALTLAPEHPLADDAYWHLALSYAKLDQPALERATYLRFLAHATSPEQRGVASLNLAETEMRLGRLGDAIAAYRAAMDGAKRLPTAWNNYVLAQWGLVVALDRYGDARAAQREAEVAMRLDPGKRSISDTEKTFFVPAYERSWYLALGDAAQARMARDARAALRFAEQAESHFADYVARATERDRWRELAVRRLAAAKKERLRLVKKVHATPAPARDAEDPVF
ncbi:MAG: tetratricopeptide repeat protein [Myxococcales bacterium]|nr:tetratricopeptide repeat protein [Myxococcales bacterium]